MCLIKRIPLINLFGLSSIVFFIGRFMMITEVMAWAVLIFIFMNIAGIYILYRFLSKRLTDMFSVWLFSICLSLGINFLLTLFGLILFLN
jgi:hypothetical protein